MMYGHPGFDGYGMGLLGWVMPVIGILVGLAFLALVILGIVMLARQASHGHPGHPGHGHGPGGAPGAGPAMRLLDERYARGEIEREEYLQRKTDLSG